MPGLDTNVVVRFLVEDDAAQTELAWAAIRQARGRGLRVRISLPVVLEVEWVLRSRYLLGKVEVVGALLALLDTTDVLIEREDVLLYALTRPLRPVPLTATAAAVGDSKT